MENKTNSPANCRNCDHASDAEKDRSRQRCIVTGRLMKPTDTCKKHKYNARRDAQ